MRLAALFLIGCAAPSTGLVFNGNAASIRPEALAVLDAMGQRWGVDLVFALGEISVDVIVQSEPITCGTVVTDGCTDYVDDDLTHFRVVLQVRDGQPIQTTAFAHEMTHIYACMFEECDHDHTNSKLWSDTANALGAYVASRSKP